MYGGFGFDTLGDTWRFDGTNWTFWAGSTGTVYHNNGDQKEFSFEYHPGARDISSVAVTTSGSAAYLIGGQGVDGSMGDIWKFESNKGWERDYIIPFLAHSPQKQ